MKIKNLIRLICLVLVVGIITAMAFSGMTVFTVKFNRWDGVINKDSELGYKYVAFYTLKAPDGAEDGFDAVSAVKEAVKIYQARFKALGYSGVVVRRAGDSLVRFELPGSTSVSGLESILENRGVLEIKNGDDVIFTNADVKSAKIKGADQETSKITVELSLTKDAKERLKNLTSNGAYSFNLTMDSDAVKATISGSDAVKNGKLDVSFSSSSDAVALAYCVDSGAIACDITAESDMGVLLSPTAGENAVGILGLAALAIFVLAAVYYIVAYKMMGVAAALSTFIAYLALEFFAATFSWFTADFAGVAGLGVAMLLIILAHIYVLNKISAQYARGKSVADSLDGGRLDAKNTLIEIACIAAVVGIGLWICGDASKSFGIALLGGGIIASAAAAFLPVHITKIFAGLGLEKCLGLKRGE